MWRMADTWYSKKWTKIARVLIALLGTGWSFVSRIYESIFMNEWKERIKRKMGLVILMEVIGTEKSETTMIYLLVVLIGIFLLLKFWEFTNNLINRNLSFIVSKNTKYFVHESSRWLFLFADFHGLIVMEIEAILAIHASFGFLEHIFQGQR